MSKVELFIVGAAKCGTTSLAEYLSSKEGFYLPEMKEPFYFVDENIGLTSMKEYESIYKDAKSSDLKIDASTGYLFDQKSAESIKHYNANAKIVIILRDPSKAVVSMWKYMKVDGVETRDLNSALFIQDSEFMNKVASNKFGWRHNYDYVNRFQYAEQIKKYKELFQEVLILTLENLISSPQESFERLEKFLDTKFYVRNDKLPFSNEGGVVNSKLLHYIRQRNYPILKKVVPANMRARIRKISRALNTSNKKGVVNIDEELKLKIDRAFSENKQALFDLYNIDFKKK